MLKERNCQNRKETTEETSKLVRSNYRQQDREERNPVKQSATSCCTQAALGTSSHTLKVICQGDAWHSSVLLNPEVNAEMDRSSAATSKQREEVPVTRISSCGTSLQQNLAAWGDQDCGAEGTMTECSSAASCIGQAKTSNTSGLSTFCLARTLQSKGRGSLGASV